MRESLYSDISALSESWAEVLTRKDVYFAARLADEVARAWRLELQGEER